MGATSFASSRATRRRSAIPVIVISVVDSAEMPDLADGYVAKPVRQDRLLGLLDELDPVPQATS